ncbi:hypothetical protein F383_35103 [Gossypium arboreum]|uniref:Uncharacterized protein n=1 Tax=Gossypium arboreum TaxID=29729 RepID=A0A0B0PVQ1_GOSAR|nr:hypothetical protein F383_35103 [Gossypium arboreum]
MSLSQTGSYSHTYIESMVFMP